MKATWLGMDEQGMDVLEATASSSLITLHGVVVGQVSPLKNSKTKSGMRYFDRPENSLTFNTISSQP